MILLLTRYRAAACKRNFGLIVRSARIAGSVIVIWTKGV